LHKHHIYEKLIVYIWVITQATTASVFHVKFYTVVKLKLSELKT